NASGSIAFKRHPLACAQPDDVAPMITVDASVMVDRCSTKMPLEFATPIASEDVVIEPAAEYSALAAFLQMTETRDARSSCVQPATSSSNYATRVDGRGSGSPLNSGFAG